MSSNSGILRVQKEFKNFKKELPEGIDCWPLDEHLSAFRAALTIALLAVISGPQGTPYQDGYFYLDIDIGEGYPMKPPACRFRTRIYHPNIDEVGLICLDILKDKWRPSLSIAKLLISLQSLIAGPNPDDPLVAEVAHVYKEDRQLFNKLAREYTIKWATANQALDSENDPPMPSSNGPKLLTSSVPSPAPGIATFGKRSKKLKLSKNKAKTKASHWGAGRPAMATALDLASDSAPRLVPPCSTTPSAGATPTISPRLLDEPAGIDRGSRDESVETSTAPAAGCEDVDRPAQSRVAWDQRDSAAQQGCPIQSEGKAKKMYHRPQAATIPDAQKGLERHDGNDDDNDSDGEVGDCNNDCQNSSEVQTTPTVTSAGGEVCTTLDPEHRASSQTMSTGVTVSSDPSLHPAESGGGSSMRDPASDADPLSPPLAPMVSSSGKGKAKDVSASSDGYYSQGQRPLGHPPAQQSRAATGDPASDTRFATAAATAAACFVGVEIDLGLPPVRTSAKLSLLKRRRV
ncbi:hypothetical protein EV182_000663 [Spiromyces aspiralis]|uniref:Uncharacterized protein n=1 Tax=Spiromyces aspiralis TaxID=68401 RepID=A0ACC1HP71_9FUNG|nr:hypothetical protein EV182_000663 [Spiromyces aspiralis]